MKKAWLFKPNEYTTSFTLTATFADGQAVFEYTKTEGSWVPKGTHSPRLVISPASESNDWCFVVRAFENDVFDAIRATYANARTSTDGVRVGMKRLVFDKDFYSTHLFEPNCDYDNPYDLFNNSDLGDICFTNLTKNITLPNKKENYGHWYGWGAYNQTKPYSKLNKINDYDNLYRMPLSWIYSTQLEGFPTIDINDSTSEHPNISKLCEAPMVDDVIYMVPLYHNETPYYDIDTNDYGEPVMPIVPEQEQNYAWAIIDLYNPVVDGTVVQNDNHYTVTFEEGYPTEMVNASPNHYEFPIVDTINNNVKVQLHAKPVDGYNIVYWEKSNDYGNTWDIIAYADTTTVYVSGYDYYRARYSSGTIE